MADWRDNLAAVTPPEQDGDWRKRLGSVSEDDNAPLLPPGTRFNIPQYGSLGSSLRDTGGGVVDMATSQPLGDLGSPYEASQFVGAPDTSPLLRTRDVTFTPESRYMPTAQILAELPPQERQRLNDATANLPPEQRRDFIVNQFRTQTPAETGGTVSAGENILSEFASPIADVAVRLPANLGIAVSDLITGNDTVPYPSVESTLPPPQSEGEAIARSTARIAGIASTFAVPGIPGVGAAGRVANAPLLAAEGGARLGVAAEQALARGLLGVQTSGRLGAITGGIGGFTAASELPDLVSGRVAPGQFAEDALLAAPRFAGDVAGLPDKLVGISQNTEGGIFNSPEAIMEVGRAIEPLAAIPIAKTAERAVERRAAMRERLSRIENDVSKLAEAKPVASKVVNESRPGPNAGKVDAGPGVETKSIVKAEKPVPSKESQPIHEDAKRTETRTVERRFVDFKPAKTEKGSESSKTLYQEMSIGRLGQILPGSSVYSESPFGVAESYFATTPDLALGQGKNKGVVIEVDGDFKTRINTDKPGLDFVQKMGGGQELIGKVSDKNLSEKIRSVTIKPGASGSPGERGKVRNSMNWLVKNRGWSKESSADGSVTYRRPEAVEPKNYPLATIKEVQSAIVRVPKNATGTQAAEHIARNLESKPDVIDADQGRPSTEYAGELVRAVSESGGGEPPYGPTKVSVGKKPPEGPGLRASLPEGTSRNLFFNTVGRQILTRVGKQGGAAGKLLERKGRRANQRRAEIEAIFERGRDTLSKALGVGSLVSGKEKPARDARKSLGGIVPMTASGIAKTTELSKSTNAPPSKSKDLGPAKSIDPHEKPKTIEGAYISKMQSLEGLTRPQIEARKDLTPAERNAALAYFDTFRSVFEIARKQGADRVYDPKTKEFVTLRDPPKTFKYIRVMTPEGSEAFYEGKSLKNELMKAHVEKLYDVLAEANGLSRMQVQERVDQTIRLGRDQRKSGPIEFLRFFDKFPASTQIEWNGKQVKMDWLERDPFNNAVEAGRFIPARAAFIAEFQSTPAKAGRTQKLGDEFLKRGGSRKDLDRFTRTMNEVPLRSDEIARAVKVTVAPRNSPQGKVLAAIGVGESLVKSAALSASFAVQLVEPFLKVPAYTGAKRLLRAYKTFGIASAPAAITDFKKAYERVEDMRLAARNIGAVTTTNIDFVARRMEHLVRAMQEGLGPSALFKVSNEVNETLVSQSGIYMAQDIKAGRATYADIADLEAMKFTPSQVRNIVEGKASARLYAEIPRRVVRFTQGENMPSSEKNVLLASGLFNRTVPFLRFPFISTESAISMTGAISNGVRKINAAKGRAAKIEAGKEFMGAVENWLKFMGSTATAGGAASLYIGALMMGRSTDRSDENWAQWLGNNMVGGGLFAQAMPFYYVATNGRVTLLSDIFDNLKLVNPTYKAVSETFDFIRGSGQYKNKTAIEKVSAYVNNRIPLAKAASRNWLIATGMAVDRDLKKYENEAFQWKRDNYLITDVEQTGYDEYKANRNKFLDAVKRGDEEAATVYLSMLYTEGGKNRSDIEASIRNMLSLTGKNGKPLTPEQEKSLRERVGERGWRLLEAKDKALLSSTRDNLAVSADFILAVNRARSVTDNMSIGDMVKWVNDSPDAKTRKERDDLRNHRVIMERYSDKVNALFKLRDEAKSKSERIDRIETADQIMRLAMKKVKGSPAYKKGQKIDIEAALRAAKGE